MLYRVSLSGAQGVFFTLPTICRCLCGPISNYNLFLPSYLILWSWELRITNSDL